MIPSDSECRAENPRQANSAGPRKVRPGANMAAIAGILLVCGPLCLAGCDRFTRKAAGPPKEQTPEVAVIVVQPEKVTITTELPGRTSAYLVAEVRPQVSGIVLKRFFNEGADVKAGDMLYQIDSAMYQAALDNALAALQRAEANQSLARLSFERTKSLLSTHAVSEEAYDTVSAKLQQAEAELAQTSATLASARVNVGYTRVTAPISGRIGKSEVTVGALATAHQGPAFTTIQQLDPIFVDATQSSANLLRRRRNLASGKIKGNTDRATVRLLLEDGTPYPQEGTLRFSDVTVDPGTGSFILRMVFPNPNQVLLPGMYVRAIVEEGVSERAILVPQRGVSRDTKGNAVALVVNGSDKVEQRTLTIERSIGDRWLVGGGLNPGDRVILEGLQSVRPGSSVKVVPFLGDNATTASAGGNQSPVSER